MESLNNLMGKSPQRRSQQAQQRYHYQQRDQRQTQEYRSGQQAQRGQRERGIPPQQARPPMRRPAPEQVARHDANQPYQSQQYQQYQQPYNPQQQQLPAPRPRQLQDEMEGQGVMRRDGMAGGSEYVERVERTAPTAPMPAYSVEQPTHGAVRYQRGTQPTQELPQFRNGQTGAEGQPMRSSQQTRPFYVRSGNMTNDYYYSDEYTAPPPSDVSEEWDEEEEEETTPGMRYGDWEEESEEVVIYHRNHHSDARSQSGIVPAARSGYASQEYESLPDEQAEQARGRTTRNLREMRMPASLSPSTYSPDQIQGRGQISTQPMSSVPYIQRVTQPLNPQNMPSLLRSDPQRGHPQGGHGGHPYAGRKDLSSGQEMYAAPQDDEIVPERQNQRDMIGGGRDHEYGQAAQPARVTRPMRPVSSRDVVPAPRRPIQPAQPVQADTLTPIIPVRNVCPKCKGAGYLRANVPYGHPQFGKPIICECKEIERKGKLRQQLREMSNLDAFHTQTFMAFNHRVPGVQEAFNVSVQYAHNPDGWLFLVGPNGSGKTHLAAAIANQILEEGGVVLFAVVPDLLDHLRAAFAPDSTEVYDRLFWKMRESGLLVLDDLGAQQSSSWANEKLFQLLNYRYNMRMPTVITANLRGLDSSDERIRSRMLDAGLVTRVTLDRARDYRPNHPKRP